MNLNRPLSFLVTTLCAFAFLVPAESAPLVKTGSYIPTPETESALKKKKEKTVGTVKIEGGGSIKINGKTAGDGAKLKCGDVLETGSERIKVIVRYMYPDDSDSKEYVIDAGTKVRITCSPRNGAVALLVIYGGVHPVGGEADFLQPLPWQAAFANGNSSFPSIGGVGGRTISTVLPTGQVVFTTVSE